MNFNYYLPVNLSFGSGRSGEIGKTCMKYGKKVFLVTGQNSTKKSGLLEKTISLIKTEGGEYILFDKVLPNPLTTTAEEGAKLAVSEGCDVVLALGGGSIIDAAKGIAFLCKNDGNINDYIYNRQTGSDALPIVAVPTTCGTGSEGNKYAVLSNPVTNDKKSLRYNCLIPKASIIDPILMKTMPKEVLASVGFDALSHNMEAFLAKLSQPITDAMALEGIRLSGKYLARVYENYNDDEGWEALSLASTIGGMVINSTSVGTPHALEHPASGLRNITHGKGLAALTPVIFKASIDSNPERFAIISRLLGGKDENDCVDTLNKLLEKINLNVTLSEQGIKEDDIPWMCENIMKVSAPNVSNFTKEFSADEFAELYRKSL
ncbi:MAG: iron-containing alcohol dehydrogenase [Lachnospiraceae bacterium]|nr:iron-containing alcohol dehydrogenase [Lachnospiraceae bacterium]